MKLLAVLALVGCLVTTVVGARLREHAYFEEEEEVTVNAIDKARAKKLTDDIIAQYGSIRGQFGVLCIVPIMVAPKPALTYAELRDKWLCTGAAKPSQDRKTHSEDMLVKEWPDLKNNLTKHLEKKEYNSYDAFLYTFNSPCPRCARRIPSSLNDSAYIYITFTQEYINNEGIRTLKETRNIFNTHNSQQRSSHIVMYQCANNAINCVVIVQ